MNEEYHKEKKKDVGFSCSLYLLLFFIFTLTIINLIGAINVKYDYEDNILLKIEETLKNDFNLIYESFFEKIFSRVYNYGIEYPKVSIIIFSINFLIYLYYMLYRILYFISKKMFIDCYQDIFGEKMRIKNGK